MGEDSGGGEPDKAEFLELQAKPQKAGVSGDSPKSDIISFTLIVRDFRGKARRSQFFKQQGLIPLTTISRR